jgi:putative N6-adenine-specific DNA methylase
LEGVLARELGEMGASRVKPLKRAVSFSGDKELMYRVNYCSRCSISVLKTVAEFRISSKDDLYKKGLEIRWSEIMDPGSRFSVSPVINSRLFTHSGYPALVLKDAVADYFRGSRGARPTVDTASPDILINLHVSNDLASVSIDSSVVPLFKRGYRVLQGEAPLNEVLAAGILLLAGWDGSSTLNDPMCGSGTILAEAGLIANRIPPGRTRSFFGFERWKDYDKNLFLRVKRESDGSITRSTVKITGSDISPRAADQARANIDKAGLTGIVDVRVADFRDLKSVDNHGYVVMNPPYGERIKPDDTAKLYDMIGTVLKHNFAGDRVWIFTSGKEHLDKVGLRPTTKIALYNGSIECILAGYDIYEGTKKKRRD